MKKNIFHMFIATLLIGDIEVVNASAGQSYSPLISTDEPYQHPELRRRNRNYKLVYSADSLLNDKNSPIGTLNTDDHLFSCLGEPWELYKQKDYGAALRPILALAKQNIPEAQYLLGEFYENGLGGLYSSLKDASKWYTQAITNSSSFSLKKKAIAGLNRAIGHASPGLKVDESYKLETYFSELSLKNDNLQYSRENLSAFLSYLKKRYTYEEIANKTKLYTTSTVCKLTNYKEYKDFGKTMNYQAFWENLKQQYFIDYKRFSNLLSKKEPSTSN